MMVGSGYNPKRGALHRVWHAAQWSRLTQRARIGGPSPGLCALGCARVASSWIYLGGVGGCRARGAVVMPWPRQMVGS